MAGLVASQFTRAKERDTSLSALLGIAGAIIGSHVVDAMGFYSWGSTATMSLPLSGQYRDNVAAAVGAIIFLLGWHQTRGKNRAEPQRQLVWL
jgi:uncharacterized membrane protein YeaQ/YmgE (transglycosylase-associated protein family)